MKTMVVGLGNILRRDEGIGVFLLEELKRDNYFKKFKDMEFIDGGTASFDAMSTASAGDRMIIIDAVKSGGETGTVYVMKPGDLREENMVDVHQAGLSQTFKWLEMEGKLPDVSILGVEVDDTSWSEGLSEGMMERLPLLKKKISDKINSIMKEELQVAGA